MLRLIVATWRNRQYGSFDSGIRLSRRRYDPSREGALLPSILSLAEKALAAPTALAASLAFLKAAEPLGATYLQTRVYQRPGGALTSEKHFLAGGVVARCAPQDWPGSAAFQYVCFACNPLLDAIRGGLTRYAFSDFASHGAKAYGEYWEALGEAGMAEALCATSYGPSRAVASLHLGFSHRDLAPEQVDTVHMAGLLLTERLMQLVRPALLPRVRLTPRERDALAFVAEGKSDWEIARILCVSESTARFHVDNARRKLGVVNRAQAVARAASDGLI